MLCESGNCPDRSDALHIKLRTGAYKYHRNTLDELVGTGSSWQCLGGVGLRDNKRIRVSSAWSGLKLSSGVAAVEWMTIAGAGALAAAVRIFIIFDEK